MENLLTDRKTGVILQIEQTKPEICFKVSGLLTVSGGGSYGSKERLLRSPWHK